VEVLFAQSKQELQEKKKQLQEEINYTNKLLEQTARTKSTSLNQLRQINKQINSREALIATMESEIELLEDSILAHQKNLDSLENQLDKLKDEYAAMILSAYRNRSAYDRFMFLFSSENFNQAFKRLKYFQQYAQFRQAQAEAISNTQEGIDQQITTLTAIKKSKEGLLQARLNEKEKLNRERSSQEEVVQSLKGKEQSLKKQLVDKKAAAEKVNKAIERIIEEEIRKAREAAKAAGSSSAGFPMTPEARELSNSFAANRGKLPWPVGEGVVIGQFGEHPHPTLKGVKVQNNGVDISTAKGNTARSVFAGKVSKVFIIPGEGKCVLIQHGEYFTLYSYFKEVFVTTGQEVDTKQNLGLLISEDDESSSTMHFEIWKLKNKLDPEDWIFNK
jgi:septal ring factor EnvC (AmiA/AmiB activator)